MPEPDNAKNDASMSKERKPLSRLALPGLVLGAIAVAAIVVSGIGYRIGWWHFTVGLRVSEWAAYGAAVASVLSMLGLFHTRPGAAWRGLLVALLGLLVALPPVVMAVHWQYAARAYPAINDISTDTEDAPVFWDMPSPTDYPGSKTAALQRAAYPDLAPLKLAMPPDQAFAQALAVAKDKGWTIVASVPAEGRLEATASSLLYGFADEVIVRVKASDGGVQVDVRSRSRIGRIDRGVNARRIRAFLAAVHERAAQARRQS